MHLDATLLERRLRRELAERLLPAIYPSTVPLEVVAWEVPGEPVSRDVAIAALRSEGRPLTLGTHFGRPWGTTWLLLRGSVPGEWSTSGAMGRSIGAIEAVVDLGFHPDSAGFQSEGLVWDAAGPVQGVHPRRTAVPLEVAGGPVELIVEVASNPAITPRVRHHNLGSLRTAGDSPLYRLRTAMLAQRDDDVFHLLLDVEVLLGVMSSLDASDKRRVRLLRDLTAAFDAIDLTDVHSIGASATRARRMLEPAMALRARDDAHRIIAVGHAHIDSAWLWPVRETIRKCARTFASAVRMIDDYPDFRFVCSQAVQYHWMETQYPELFARISERVARGAWQPVGGMWVEADMNLPSGESLVRQLVHGQRYFESRFGVRCREAWIPDVFGYPASLPQIFRSAGCTRFVTQKLSWNRQNRFPHSTFWWEGLDGSRVLTHFPPVDTYNATVVGEELTLAEQNFTEHQWSDWSLMPFGHGNGGGGPTREMIERMRRTADLAGVPRVSPGTTDEFFEHIEAEIAAGAPAPVWNGELYFEMHRGTFTSQVRTKMGNRRCERLLHEAELWWASGGDVPAEVADELDGLWKDVLLQQFHDILPGSSITWVHEDAEATHARVGGRLEQLVATALERVAAGEVVANASSRRRSEVIESAMPPDDGPVQQLADGRTAWRVSVPGHGLAPAVAEQPDDVVHVTEHSFANSSVAVSWDLDGSVTSVIDLRTGREIVPVGHSVQLELAPDHPVEYDAWDLESWTAARGVVVGGVESVEVIDGGPLVARLRVVRTVGRQSRAITDLVVRAGSPRVDLTIDVDWHEDESLLSLMIPLDVRAREAACGIQFGHVMRPTHASTSWDAAKFEVCAHGYVDLSEAGWGVAILDDGRYGHGLQTGGVRVSLLRAAKFPDPEQDHGRHTTTVSLLAHGPGLHEVIAEAEALARPLRRAAGSAATSEAPVVEVDHPSVTVSAVKRADDGSGDLVVRLAEVCGGRAAVTLRAPGRIDRASRCTSLEEPQSAIDVTDGIVALTVRPFELVTLRLTMQPPAR